MASGPPKVSGLVKGNTSRTPHQFNREFGTPPRDNKPPEADVDLGENTAQTPPTGGPTRLAVHLLDDSPSQYRLVYPPEEIDSLAKTLLGGQIEPIRVRRRANGRYEIIAGHRRTRAARSAGIEFLDAVVVTIDDKRAALEVILHNESQEAVGDFERATGYRMLKEAGFKQVEIADQLGISKSLITGRLKFFEFPEQILTVFKSYPRAISHNSVPQLLSLLEETPDLLPDLVDGIQKIGVGDWTAAVLFSVLRQKQSQGTNQSSQKPKALSITDSESRPLLTVQGKPKGKVELQLAPGIDQDTFIKKLTQLMREAAEKGDATLFGERS